MSWRDELRKHQVELLGVVQNYGLAMMAAGALERAVAALVVIVEELPDPEPAVVRERLPQAFTDTFGTLRRRLREAEHAPDVHDGLKSAQTTRDWLAHHFFAQRYLAMFEPRRYPNLNAELDAARAEFEETFAEVQHHLYTLGERVAGVRDATLTAATDGVITAVVTNPDVAEGVSGWDDLSTLLQRIDPTTDRATDEP